MIHLTYKRLITTGSYEIYLGLTKKSSHRVPEKSILELRMMNLVSSVLIACITSPSFQSWFSLVLIKSSGRNPSGRG